MSDTNAQTTTFEQTTKRTKKQLAEDAVKRFLQEAGYTVMKATVEVGEIRKLDDDARGYRHEWVVSFDGALES